MKKGALHRELKVPKGKKIPAKKLAAAAKKGGKEGKRARLAETLKKFQDWDLFLTLAERGGRGAFVKEVLFKIIAGGTMSSWLPGIVYRLPWLKLQAKDRYQEAKEII